MGELNEWLCRPTASEQESSQFRCNTSELFFYYYFLPALGNFPAKAVTFANYAYTSVDCVNPWLWLSA